MPHSWLRAVGDWVVFAGDAFEGVVFCGVQGLCAIAWSLPQTGMSEPLGFGASLEVEVCGAHGLGPLFCLPPGKLPPGDFGCDGEFIWVSLRYSRGWRGGVNCEL